MELGNLRLFDIDEHHEDVSEDHVWFAFHSDLSSQVFSQAVHEAFNCVVIVLLVMCVMLTACIKIVHLHTFDGEQRL